MTSPLFGSTNLPDAVPPDASTEKHVRFAQFRHLGMPRAEICRVMSITGVTHDRWLELPNIQQMLDQLQIKQETHVLMLKDRLKQEAYNLVDELLILSRDPTVPSQTRASIKQDLLDREGSVPRRTHVESSGERKIFSDDQFNRLMDGMEESARRGMAP
jgi:hypothetical protein